MDFAGALEARGIQIPCKHVCNSAGIIDIPEGDLDMVRFGVTLYGMYPTDEVTKERMPVSPAMEVKTHISQHSVNWECRERLKDGVTDGYHMGNCFDDAMEV